MSSTSMEWGVGLVPIGHHRFYSISIEHLMRVFLYIQTLYCKNIFIDEARTLWSFQLFVFTKICNHLRPTRCRRNSNRNSLYFKFQWLDSILDIFFWLKCYGFITEIRSLAPSMKGILFGDRKTITNIECNGWNLK